MISSMRLTAFSLQSECVNMLYNKESGFSPSKIIKYIIILFEPVFICLAWDEQFLLFLQLTKVQYLFTYVFDNNRY